MKSNKKFRKDDLSPENNTKKIYKMYKRKKQWVVAPVLIGLLLNAFSPVAAFAVTEIEQANAEMAQSRVVDEEVQKLITQAITNIQELVSLKPDEKTTYVKEVKEAEDKTTVDSILVQAYQADIAQQAINIETEYIAKIDGLSSLKEDDRETHKTSVINKLDLETLKSTFNQLTDPTKYGEAKKAFETSLLANKLEADKIVETVKAENEALANLPKYKEQQKKIIADMTYLSAIEKDNYTTKITNAENKQAVDKVVDEAQAANNEVLTGLVNEKARELEEKLTLSSLAENIKANFTKSINEIKDKQDKIDADLVELATISSDIDKAIADNTSAELSAQKNDVKAQITKAAEKFVKQADVKRFHNKVDAATTKEAVEAVKKEWDQFLAVETIKQQENLKKAQEEATKQIDLLGLEDETTKTNYIAHISVATSPEEVAGILAEAQAVKKQELVALVAVQEAAVKEIQALSNLTNEEKAKYVEEINKTITSKSVKETLDSAKSADKLQEVVKAKVAALKELDTLELPTEKETYIEEITAVENQDPNALKQIDDIMAQATKKSDINKINAADLSDAKTIAANAVKKLDELTASQVTAALKSINEAKNVTDVAKALDTASELNDINKGVKNKAAELLDAKNKAKEAIDAMEYLSVAAKEGYKAEVNAQTEIGPIEVIQGKADKANKTIKEKQNEIQAAKVAVVTMINQAPELTVAEKLQFSNQVFKCSTEAEVDIIKSKVSQLINDRKVAAAKEADAIATINQAISDLEKEGLDSSQVRAYQDKIKLLSKKEDMVAVYEEAKAETVKIHDKKLIVTIDSLIASGSYVQAQESIDKLKSDNTRKQYQTKLNNSIALSEAKAAANEQIDALENLTVEEKKTAKEDIAKLTTKAAVDKAVEKLVKADNLVHDKTLIELAEAQIKSKDFDKAAKTIEKIRDADTKAKLQKQLEDAQKVAPTIKGTGHVSKIGWQKTVAMNEIIGTTGRKLALEAVKLNLADVDMPESAKKIEGGIQYRAHVRNIGWQGYKANGALAGTTGKSLQMEAIQIRLTGELAKRYDVQYRAHSKDKGWSSYVSNGATAGTTGKSLRMEALQIRLVEKK